MDVDSPQPTTSKTVDPVAAVKDHLEVTGVSRSGRVCKKSSKLLDFQAADDNEPKPKRATPAKKPVTPKSPMPSKRLAVSSPKSDRKTFDQKNKTPKHASKSDNHHRPTAYMLWAKDYRARMKVTNPGVKTSSYAHKLASLWAEVPNNEKYSWRRRARRAADQEQEQQKSKEKHSPITKSNKLVKGAVTDISKIKSPSKPVYVHNPYENVKFETLSLDAAAHLKLLGENLNLIGERLKQHEGQINVSGSLSVLLDSMLCSMGPLMILTKAIPKVRNDAQLNRNLHSTIDNLSYIMPGL